MSSISKLRDFFFRTRAVAQGASMQNQAFLPINPPPFMGSRIQSLTSFY